MSECIRDSFSQQQYLLWVDAFLAGHFQITKPNLCFGILFEYELFVVEIFIENKDIGKVIGKGGDIISKIRQESGALIKIFDKRVGTKRKVKISGKESKVNLAKQKIIECLP